MHGSWPVPGDANRTAIPLDVPFAWPLARVRGMPNIYNYFDVTQDVFEQMRAAPSKGGFLAQEIKGAYRYPRM